ncbi:MAG TPA: Ig-like domain-containing protein, partial [Anaerolineales bacterium]|nr:Ig-like domain-containing protein [Anaerolineales bacterium]
MKRIPFQFRSVKFIATILIVMLVAAALPLANTAARRIQPMQPAQSRNLAIANPQAWSNVYHGTSDTQSSLAYTVNSGTNRLLVVAVATSIQAVGARTVSVSYGGQSLAPVDGDIATTTIRQHSELYYLNEAGFQAAGSSTGISFTISGGTTRVNDVFAAVYTGVDQNNPITDHKQYNSGTSSVSSLAWASALTVNAGDQAVEIISSVRSGNTTPRTFTYATNWSSAVTEQTYSTGDGVRNGVGKRSVPSSNTTDTSSMSFNGTALASMTGMSLKMAPNSTNAGTATAVAGNQAGTIIVNMPYTNDDNGDNTYTVDYKLSSDSTWTNKVTNATHTASPYTVTISGLTGNSSYDVRCTYIDGDGLTGTAIQTITGIIPKSIITMVANGTSPASKTAKGSATNQAVSAFTVSTSQDTDTVTGLTVTLSGTGLADVAAVSLYQDANSNGEYDSGETLIATSTDGGKCPSCHPDSGSVVFSGLSISASTTAVQYLVTLDTTASPVNGDTIQAYASGASATNPVIDNAGVQATLTIDVTPPAISSVSPLTGAYINNITTSSKVSYTLSETVTSATITMTSTSGSDLNSIYTCHLTGSSVLSGTSHTAVNLATYCSGGAPALVSGSVYTFAFDATDPAGNAAIEQTSTGVTYDITVPTVSTVSTSAPAGSYYKSGQTVPVLVTFSEPVLVTGTPRIRLNVSSSAVYANYVSGSSGSTLTFNYVVGSSQNSTDLDYYNNSALGLNGGTITDLAGNTATLTLPATGSGSANDLLYAAHIVIDTTAPTVAFALQAGSDSGASSTDNITNAASLVFNVTFSEALNAPFTGTGLSNTGTATGCAISVGTPTGNVYPVTLDTCQEGTVILTLAAGSVADLAGNPNALTNGTSVKVDRTGPTYSSSTPADGGTGANSIVSITWNENIICSTVTTTTVTISPAPAISWNQTSCSNATAVFTANGLTLSSQYTVSLGTGVEDVAGNPMASGHS